MNSISAIFVALAMFAVLALSTGCQTSDATLREQGRNESYIMGFHDGRHSGMKEAGNYFEHMVKDTGRFESDTDYKAGWLAGEAEGQRIQEAANAATESSQAGKIADEAGPHPHDAMKKATKGMNTEDLRVLEQ